jgi:hypothetical protein
VRVARPRQRWPQLALRSGAIHIHFSLTHQQATVSAGLGVASYEVACTGGGDRGGVVGISTLYHLVKKGWSDVVLVERGELTAGSTWHAAGLLPLFNMSYTVGQLHKSSVEI